MSWFLAICGTLALTFTLLLMIPIGCRARGSGYVYWSKELEVAMFFGILRVVTRNQIVTIMLAGRQIHTRRVRSRSDQRSTAGSAQPSTDSVFETQRDWLHLLITLPSATKRALNVLFRSVRLTAHLQLEFGFDDPALTGEVAGYLSVLHAAYPSISVALYPNFWQPKIDGYIDLVARFTPLILLSRVLRLMVSSTGRGAIRALRGLKSPKQ